MRKTLVYILFTILFVILVCYASDFGGNIWVLKKLGVFHNPLSSFLIIGTILTLATYRLTKLIVKDTILKPYREAISKRKETSVFAEVLTELVGCQWCSSMWSAVLMVIAFFSGMFGFVLTIVFALSGLSVILNNLTNK